MYNPWSLLFLISQTLSIINTLHETQQPLVLTFSTMCQSGAKESD